MDLLSLFLGEFMSLIFKLIYKELKNHPRFVVLFILNASLGLTGFITLDIFQNSIDQMVKKQSKEMMGADLSVSLRRLLTEKEKQIVSSHLPKKFNRAQVISTYSMISNTQTKKSHLSQIKAIPLQFPFYGKIQTKNQTLPLHKEKTAWLYPEMITHLGLQIGDWIQIGKARFQVTGIIEKDPANSFVNDLAPVIYISSQYIKDTQLIGRGSLVNYSYFYKIKQQNSFQLNQIQKNIFNQLNDPTIQVKTHENNGETLTRLIQYLNDFLSLISICTLFLACIGLVFLFRSYFKSKIQQIAILLSLGFKRKKIFFLYLIQILTLSILSFMVSLVLTFILLPILQQITSSFLPFEIHWSSRTLSLTSLIVLITPLWVVLPILAQIRKIKTSLLLREKTPLQKDYLTGGLYSIGILVLWGLSIWQSHSFKIGSSFIGFFLGLTLLLFFIGGALLIFSNFLLKRFHLHPLLRWSLRDLIRHPLSSLSCFVSLILGVLLLNIPPQIQETLNREIKAPENFSLPSLFLFDIQEHQVESLQKHLDQNNIPIDKIIPMIQSRLETVNGSPFDKGSGKTEWSRERTREMRFRNRTFNLSYQNQMGSSEKLIDGKMWQGPTPPNEIPGISIEQRFAKRMGFKIKDQLIFKSQNQTIEGVIQNIRQVNWMSFQPNFFIFFQPHSSLETLPKTFLATLNWLTPEEKYQIQNSITQLFPNISSIDISRLTSQIVLLTQQMSRALQLITLLCLLMALTVLFSIVSHQVQGRTWDIGLLKTLGASFKEIQILFLSQFGLMALTSSFLGLVSSLLVSFFISIFIFEAHWKISMTPFILMLISLILTLWIIHRALRNSLSTPAQKLLKSR